MSLALKLTDFQEEPFSHGIFSSVFSPTVHAVLLDWLEETDRWALTETDFYEQYEFCVDDVRLPKGVEFIQSAPFRR